MELFCPYKKKAGDRAPSQPPPANSAGPSGALGGCRLLCEAVDKLTRKKAGTRFFRVTLLVVLSDLFRG